jgi:hypothetical protein
MDSGHNGFYIIDRNYDLWWIDPSVGVSITDSVDPFTSGYAFTIGGS